MGEKGRWGERFILWFENIASEYGTNWIRPILWIVAIIFLLEVEVYHFLHGLIIKTITVDNFGAELNQILFDALSNLNIFNTFEKNQSGIDLLFNIIKGILISTLLYETIKSFRKYSRKL